MKYCGNMSYTNMHIPWMNVNESVTTIYQQKLL
jgi:hypothetical protein